ncbi:hypothetical protein ACFLV0_05425 [Chloroflexota bacterium]
MEFDSLGKIMKLHRVIFTGSLLERGFWLYVWRVKSVNADFVYVGRTGDSSSKYAASPFSRLSRHLDISENASANMLLRHIKRRGLDPISCSFEIIALGPLYKEQYSLEEHRKIRDIVAPLENVLAHYLHKKGYEVVGSHPSGGEVDKILFAEIQGLIDKVR